MLEINAEELMRQAKLSKVQFVGGPRDGDTLTPLSFKIEHLVSTHSLWWTDKNSVSFYLLSKKDEDYCMMYVGGNVDKLLEVTSEVYGKVPPDLLQVVPLLRSMEKGCQYEGLHGTGL
jgi:hypothetical protein